MEQGTGAPGETVPARIAADRVRGISSRETLWIAFTVSPSRRKLVPDVIANFADTSILTLGNTIQWTS